MANTNNQEIIMASTLKLETNSALHDDFPGACDFADGTTPLFAKINVYCDYDYNVEATLVLDSGFDKEDEPTLTINLSSYHGDVATIIKKMEGHDRASAHDWAQKHLDSKMTLLDLETLGFTFEEC